MQALATLYEPISAELEKVCVIFDQELSSDLTAVNELCAHIRHYRGKMLRPALLLLSARACGKVTDEHLTLAAVVEMVHVATLVHDDVLDEAELRRRYPTINLLQGNEAAVLLGDYLISHAYHLCSSLHSSFAARAIGSATNTVCEGELQQVFHRGDTGITLEQYLQIVGRKTAALTSTCCLLGAHYAGAPTEFTAALERYGLDVGIAFQITDDVLDLVGAEEDTGKTVGRDLEECELTLPIIHGLAHGEEAYARELQRLVGSGNGACDRIRVRQLLESTDSFAYALDAAARYVESAVTCVSDLPRTDARDALVCLARMILNRDR